jgi:hypothetical protein
MRGHAWRASAFTLGLLLGAGSAGADEPSAEDRARLPALLRAGADAAKAKKWDACIAALSEAVRIKETPETLGKLGLCEEADGQHDVDAYHHLSSSLRSPGVDASVEPYRAYNAALVRVEARVARILVWTSPTDGFIIVDSKPLG